MVLSSYSPRTFSSSSFGRSPSNVSFRPWIVSVRQVKGCLLTSNGLIISRGIAIAAGTPSQAGLPSSSNSTDI